MSANEMKSKNRAKSVEQGFTLIEMAVVMVIIGFLLGTGVLMSQSLIQGMHSKEIMNTIQDLSASARYFKDKYHYLPGDLPSASDDIAGIAAGSTCDIVYNASGSTVEQKIGNGLIDTTTEAECVILQLAMAGFIAQDPNEEMKSRFGAIRIMANSTILSSITTCSALQTAWDTPGSAVSSYVQLPKSVMNVIEFYNLPWDVAKELDRNMDDGNLAYPEVTPLPNPVLNSDLILGGTIQVDTDCDLVGNQGPGSDMSSDITYFAVPL